MKCFLSALFVNSGVFFFFFYQFDQNVNLLQKCHFKDYLKESNSHTKGLETNVTMPFNGNQYGGKH